MKEEFKRILLFEVQQVITSRVLSNVAKSNENCKREFVLVEDNQVSPS